MTIEECAVKREPRPFPDTPTSVLQQLSMEGKTSVITGAADGIGLAAVESLLEAGSDIAMVYRSNDSCVAKAEEFSKKSGKKVKAFKCDVADHKAVQQLIQDIVKEYGRIDCFIANAGMAISKPILEQTIEEYQKQMDVNVNGVFYCAKYVGEVFKKQGFGNLIITSSMSAHIVNVPIDQPTVSRLLVHRPPLQILNTDNFPFSWPLRSTMQPKRPSPI